MVNIRHNFTIKAPVANVYEAIATLEGLRRWWTTDAKGSADINGAIQFGFGGEMFNTMKVTGKEKNKKITWDCTDGPSDWIGTELIFTLSQDREKNTLVQFEHNKWKKSNEFYGSCNYHWGLFMKSLKTLCETGKGNPHVVE